MIYRIIIFLILFQINAVYAVTNININKIDAKKVENELYYNYSQIADKIPEDFLGALLECNPYCQVISVKLDNNKWVPDLNNLKNYQLNFKLIDIDDPLFKALFPDDQELAKKLSENRKNKKIKDQELNQLVSSKVKNKKKEEKDPELQVPFNNGLSYSLGVNIDFISQKSQGNVQKSFNPKRELISIPAEFIYLRNKPIWLFKEFWKFEFQYNLELINFSTKNQSGDTLKKTSSGMIFTTWLYKPKYHLGLRIRTLKQEFKTTENQLESYSFSEDLLFMGLSYKKDRSKYYFDYALKYLISEEQPFRSSLTSADQFILGYEYCQKSQKIIKTNFKFIPCYDLEYLYSANQSEYSPEYVSSGLVSMSRNEIKFKVLINFGEDLYR